jgi:chemotaxis protein methyltransferase CheR
MTHTTNTDHSPAFDEVLAHVDSLGFRSDVYGRAYLNRRVNSRMRRLGTTDHEEYLAVLRNDPDEGAALLDALSVNVTSFFRNPDVWTALEPVLEELAAERGSLRAWSAPSSDGREPYSLAMLASDVSGLRTIDVLGTDIDPEALTRARAGVYTDTQTTDIGAELAPVGDWGQYVARSGDRYTVGPSVKRLVSFEQHDLVRDGPKSGFDLVLSRNLLIYIAPGHKETIVSTLTDSLRVGGYLVIGLTETLPAGSRDRFEPVDQRRRIYRKVA